MLSFEQYARQQQRALISKKSDINCRESAAAYCNGHQGLL
jgi:hypothetical protein